MDKLRIVIGGFIGLYPSGGVTWDYIQYPLGFHLLGHDVYYIEDTMQYSRYQSPGQNWDDPSDSVQYLKETMERFGLGERWAYRDIATGNCYGMSLTRVLEVCETADLFINISASTFLREEYLKIPKRALIDSDPMFTQVQDWDDSDPEKSLAEIKKVFSHYNYLFTFGENINAGDCKIPTYELTWIPTRQPVCLEHWHPDKKEKRTAFTTVMNWSTRKKLIYLNEEWGQKDVEFEKIFQVPNQFRKAPFEIIVADSSKKLDYQELANAGWKTYDPLEKINNIDDYRSFIESSLGEFSVAKETYVKSNSGWFSCRSACYLAAGRPVVVQETQWSKYIPSGAGLLSFSDTTSAINSLEAVFTDIEKHSKSAKEVAHEYFDSNKVLADMISRL
jgi:hypothetical protein